MQFATKASLLAAAIALMFGTTSASAAAVTITCPTANNVDTADPTIVNCIVPSIPNGHIKDLDVSLEINGGGWVSDLEIILSHNGVDVTLYDPGVDSTGSMDAVFDDSAGPPPGSGSAIGTFRPQGPGTLADFNGLSFAGLWQLSIEDNIIPGDGENLVRFNLIAQLPEPSSLALLGIGLAGAGMAIRRRRKVEAR